LTIFAGALERVQQPPPKPETVPENEERGLEKPRSDSPPPTTENLLDRASNLREDISRVRADQPHRPHDDDENDRKHHRVLGDILTLFIFPKTAPKTAPKIAM
jgi:hypothetical protein